MSTAQQRRLLLSLWTKGYTANFRRMGGVTFYLEISRGVAKRIEPLLLLFIIMIFCDHIYKSGNRCQHYDKLEQFRNCNVRHQSSLLSKGIRSDRRPLLCSIICSFYNNIFRKTCQCLCNKFVNNLFLILLSIEISIIFSFKGTSHLTQTAGVRISCGRCPPLSAID